MKKIKFLIGVLAILCAATAIFFALNSDKAIVIHPKGIIAHDQLHLIKKNLFLMLIVVVPTIILLFAIAWRYRVKNSKAKYDPEHIHSPMIEWILWIIPTCVIAVMAVITYKATHQLDPYKPLKSEVAPLTMQVVALNWKWLFIYPEQGIATVNFVQFPERTPIHFSLTADDSPMNSFWIPQLSGQIYAMSGMVTSLHLMADGTGEYTGRAAEINGEGFADMTFVVKSTSQSEFDEWVRRVKKSPLRLNEQGYNELVKPSINNPITLYSDTENDLFNKIIWKNSSSEN